MGFLHIKVKWMEMEIVEFFSNCVVVLFMLCNNIFQLPWGESGFFALKMETKQVEICWNGAVILFDESFMFQHGIG